MADKEKMKVKFSAMMYYLVLIVALVGFIFFMYLMLTGGSLFLFGYVFGCYSVLFTVMTFVLMVCSCALLKANGGKLNMKNCISSAAMVISLVCLIYSGIVDIRHSKTADMLILRDGRSAILTEYTEKNGKASNEYTYIDVYLLHGRMADRLGRIDETYFSNRCVEADRYAYSLGDDNNTLVVECEYGSFGNGTVCLEPSYGLPSMKYEFKLK